MSHIVEIQSYDPATSSVVVDRVEWYEPDSTEHVMANVHTVMRAGTVWSTVARLLVPMAFQLLCKAAFRE